MKSTVSIAALFGLVGCAPSFMDRHDLLGFRIAAVGVEDGYASAAIWSGRLFHEAPPLLEWSADGVSLGEGWEVEVPVGAQELELSATAPDGQTREARVSVAEPAPPIVWERLAVQLGQDLSIGARQRLEETAVDAAAPDGAAVRLRVQGDPEMRARWMVANGSTTVLELDAMTVDVTGRHIEFDDGEVVSDRTVAPATHHILVLVMDGMGANRWKWIDAGIGTDGSLLSSDGWLLPAEVPADSGLYRVTVADLTADGVAQLSGVVPVETIDGEPAPECGPAGRPFSFDWLANGRCTVADIVGQQVVLEVP